MPLNILSTTQLQVPRSHIKPITCSYRLHHFMVFGRRPPQNWYRRFTYYTTLIYRHELRSAVGVCLLGLISRNLGGMCHSIQKRQGCKHLFKVALLCGLALSYQSGSSYLSSKGKIANFRHKFTRKSLS